MKKKIRRYVLILLVFILFIPAIYLGLLFYIHDFDHNFLKIDQCLDNGGRWDYNDCECKQE